MTNEQKLLQLKQQIDSAKQEVSQLKGQQKALLSQLKSEWKCDTVEDAKKLQTVLKQELEGIEADIERGMKELEEKYEL